MNKKQLSLISVLSPILIFPVAQVSGSPLVSVGDSVDIYFNGSTGARWVSNVYRKENNETSDLIYTVSPGFEVNFGRGTSALDFSVITRFDILRYTDESRLNTELFSIRGLGSYKSSRLDLNGSVGFSEVQSSAGDENLPAGFDDLIESENTTASLNGEYRLSPKFSFGAGINYSKREYVTFENFFADRESYRFPFDVFYELTPKVDLSLGYSYTRSEVDPVRRAVNFTQGGYETDQHFFNVGARGDLLPKLKGFFKVGYRLQDSYSATDFDPTNPLLRNRRDTASRGTLGLDGSLTWSATPKLTTALGFSRDFGVAGEGTSTENTSVDLSASYAIKPQWSASAKAGYTNRDYVNGGRDDDQLDLGLRLAYSPNQYWSVGGGYTYQENDSNLPNASYENHILDVSVSLRY